jgi:hypothetical protein
MRKKSFNLKTPVLFLVFNRLDTTKKVFAEIKKAKPKQLFIASDGFRENKTGEKEIVEEIRKYVLENINWGCNVKTLFREKNLGCKYAVAGAIDWFFENVEQGIILEDDCLPSQSFFSFCEEMLERYKDDKKVTSVFALSPIKIYGENSYYFIKTVGLWGWASWRRAWKKIYRKEEKYMKSIPSSDYLKEVFPNFIERFFFKKRFYDSLTGKVNTWEFPWILGIVRSKGFNIIPKFNLIENIGVQEDFTNTKPNFIDKKFLRLCREEMRFPLVPPKKVKMNKIIYWRLIVRDILRVMLKRLLFFL